MHNILISNAGYGDSSPEALHVLKQHANVIENKDRIRFSESDFNHLTKDVSIIIAGTEKVTENVIKCASSLKLISRVGVGVDNIALEAARERKIFISYTPDAPARAVPEFTLSLMLNLLKGISLSDRKQHQGIWYKPIGRMLSSCRVGIVGAGKIGCQVIKMIQAIAPDVNIVFSDPNIESVPGAQKCDLSSLLKTSDIVSLHLPYTSESHHLINKARLQYMKKGSNIINTSRGGIIDEEALFDVLQSGHLSAAAIDVFEKEPYSGKLASLENCLLTAHIGSSTKEVRAIMENQVAEDVVSFITQQKILRPLENYNFVG